jgi:hypothetical protein
MGFLDRSIKIFCGNKGLGLTSRNGQKLAMVGRWEPARGKMARGLARAKQGPALEV